MPTQTAQVGPQLIPVPTAGPNSPLTDPTLDGLLAFLGFLIQDALNAKLAEMGGPTTSAPITDACPVANRFAFNHDNTFMRPMPTTNVVPLPGLWAWETRSTMVEQTLYYYSLQREISIQYIFPQLATPGSMQTRSGLLGAIARVMARFAARGRHPNFAIGNDPNGVPYQLGTPVYQSLGLIDWQMTQGTPGFLQQVPQTPRGDAGGSIQRGFPSYLATFQVREYIYPPQPTAADLLGDSPTAIDVYEDENAPLTILNRVVVPPDGSKDPP